MKDAFHNSGARSVSLQAARDYAQSGHFPEMLAVCRNLMDVHDDGVAVLLDTGALLSGFGFVAQARECFERVRKLAPDDPRPVVNLANLANDAGDHAQTRMLYAGLLESLPNHPVMRRNAVVSMEYDPAVSDADRFAQAVAWGEWAVARAGGRRSRPPLRSLDGVSLRIGYVSADFCQHTVGLFVKEVLKAHDSTRVQVVAYSAGQVKDWVTDEIRAACTFRDVAALDDAALVEQIRNDGIDVLIDLSGHTAGSRLTVFAHRPAPAMVSWLGYFATTGLPYMDAVLLDQWHAPPDTENRFVEFIIRLPQGRFCYQPVPWAPDEVAPSPVECNGYITFGCFNNTAKFNDGVFDLWARILRSVPNSRLILKWRTFNDDVFRQKTTQAFIDRGIAPERIELRGPSFHVDLLKEYADIDIALDSFPFTGGLTSCEALWMGVPVVTWPQSRVVSRQTHALLHQIGLPELLAKDADDYVRIAVNLARDREGLMCLRGSLRQRMQASPLCDVSGFTRALETALINLYRKIETNKETTLMTPRILLNVGAGHPRSGACIPAAFRTPEWQELRLDIDPANEPDIIGTMLDMSAVGGESVDAIYSSHTIEHLYPNEIPQAMKEFLRVLKPEGYAVITCPDLQAAAEMIVQDKLMDVAYTSPAGLVTPFDIVYSHRMLTGRNNPYMAHHCGFTLKVLSGTLQSNGFASVAGKRRAAAFDLWVVATKEPMEEVALRELAGKVLPE